MRKYKINTIYTCQKQGEKFVMPSRTIPGHDLSAREALEYLSNNEPIPARFLSQRTVLDKDGDGIIDAEVHMLDLLDTMQISEERKSYLSSKMYGTEVHRLSLSRKSVKEEDIKPQESPKNVESLQSAAEQIQH